MKEIRVHCGDDEGLRVRFTERDWNRVRQWAEKAGHTPERFLTSLLCRELPQVLVSLCAAFDSVHGLELVKNHRRRKGRGSIDARTGTSARPPSVKAFLERIARNPINLGHTPRQKRALVRRGRA